MLDCNGPVHLSTTTQSSPDEISMSCDDWYELNIRWVGEQNFHENAARY